MSTGFLPIPEFASLPGVASNGHPTSNHTTDQPQSHGGASGGLPGARSSLPRVGGVSRGGAGERRGSRETRDQLHARLVAKWQAEPGQAWSIASNATPGHYHRLVIGDCSRPDVVRLACPSLVNGIFTSPPYADRRATQYRGIHPDRYGEWFRPIQSNLASVLAPNGSFFLNLKPHSADFERHLYVAKLVATMVEQWDWRFVDEFAWIRSGPPGAWPNRFKNGFEPVYHFSLQKAIKFRPFNVAKSSERSLIGVESKRTRSANGSGFSRKPSSACRRGPVLPSNVVCVNVGTIIKGHPATFPVGLPEFFVRAFSDPGDVWLDPFCGSGTTLLACEMTGRIGAGIEEQPAYAAIALERLAAAGLNPVLARSGLSN